ncbi:MAG TPA: 3-mercaptopyruvate sulfurtransferase [Caulobacteraceae bacterium]|nr:3-mercaptopyruvate sulfurtransferase [Caulobacteraceae bacterium]
MTKDPIVSTAWLAERLDDPKITIFDASWFMPGSPRDPDKEYAAAHIPGAVRFDIDALSDHANPLPHMLSAPSDFAVAMRRLGLNAGSTAVIYDSEGLFSAARAWWNLRAMGNEASFVLEGGLPRWIAEGRAVETGWREPEHGNFKAHPRTDLVEDLEAVRETLERKSAQVVDARSAARFSGEAPEPRAGLRGGHMPGAFNLPSSAVVEDGALLPAGRLREAFHAARIDTQAPIVTTCGSGVSAAILALALARLGRLDVPVYDGSWTEWGGRSDTPVATGA